MNPILKGTDPNFYCWEINFRRAKEVHKLQIEESVTTWYLSTNEATLALRNLGKIALRSCQLWLKWSPDGCGVGALKKELSDREGNIKLQPCPPTFAQWTGFWVLRSVANANSAQENLRAQHECDVTMTYLHFISSIGEELHVDDEFLTPLTHLTESCGFHSVTRKFYSLKRLSLLKKWIWQLGQSCLQLICITSFDSNPGLLSDSLHSESECKEKNKIYVKFTLIENKPAAFQAFLTIVDTFRAFCLSGSDCVENFTKYLS